MAKDVLPIMQSANQLIYAESKRKYYHMRPQTRKF